MLDNTGGNGCEMDPKNSVEISDFDWDWTSRMAGERVGRGEAVVVTVGQEIEDRIDLGVTGLP
ncbi:hypothetical protein PO002_07325 [Cupriavidus necator]|uniref:hypothetical protein n=1 Tax=Cupriavidus necator TaxID=106590 RepID=UPI0039C322A0